jgi:IS30 family transposase
MARPRADIDWKKVDKYLQAHCDGAGIAGLLGIDPETLYRACQRDHKIGFSEYAAQKKGEGKELLRAKQFETAMSGNVSMQIWLGKQYLNQRDRAEMEQSGTTTNLNITVDSSDTAVELKKLIGGA